MQANRLRRIITAPWLQEIGESLIQRYKGSIGFQLPTLSARPIAAVRFIRRGDPAIAAEK
ncbi:hypothetical protein [Neisseria elongata]|uniref:hypothetical protein n=1 Tax=Neisseria elongata TaxID=495 RepID=UPI000669A046|nr:hypothetical protein [Neisseria elongata]